MLRLGFRGLSLFAAACLLCVIAATGVALADEGDDVSHAIVTHIRQRLAATPLAAADENRISPFVHYILNRYYYPVSARDLTVAANTAVDATDQQANGSDLVQAAVTGIVGSLGHGARLLTTLGGGDQQGDGANATPATHDVGSLRLVSLPSMNVSDANVAHTCADFIRYVDGQSIDGVTGFILDLRGNEGGPLTDSSCLASLFLKKGQALFQVVSKQGNPVKYESEANGHGPISLPVAVLIDNRTDKGGLLVAAILQDHHRATVIGEQKAAVNGAVASLVFPPGANRGIVLPTGEILLPDKHPLAAGIRVDVTVSAHDDNALLAAAQTYLAQRR